MSNNSYKNMATSAMNYAIPLGFFWVFKYLFIILGDYSELSKYIANLLNIGTPILYYTLLTRYKTKERDGKIDFGDCILFSLLLFLFASFLECVIICLHIYIINPAYATLISDQIYKNAEHFSYGSAEQQIQYKNLIDSFAANIRILIVMSILLWNIILGLILSVVLGYFVSKKDLNQI